MVEISMQSTDGVNAKKKNKKKKKKKNREEKNEKRKARGNKYLKLFNIC